MNSIPENIRSIFRKLNQAGNPKIPPLPEQEERQYLETIGQLRDPAALRSLFNLLCRGKESSRNMAAETIERIVMTANVLELAQTDANFRHMSEWSFRYVVKDEVAAIARGLVGPIGLLSFHGSGYVRQAAVEKLGDFRDGRELPFLLIRLNDWVPQVRIAAKPAVEARVLPDYAANFVRCLPLIYRLEINSREDHRPLIDSIVELLSKDETRSILRRSIVRGNRQVARSVLRFLLERPKSDLLSILVEATESGDPPVRLRAAQELRVRLEGDELRILLDRLGRHRDALLRRESLFGYAERLPELAQDHLQNGLLDTRRVIREAARFYLRGRGSTSFVDVYAAELGHRSARHRAMAVCGVAEVGERQNARQLIPLLQDPTPIVRKAAVRAVGRLDSDGYSDEIFAAIDDASAGVARAARDVLRGSPGLLQPHRIWASFETTDQPHSRRLLISLMAELQWWESAPLLLRATAYGDDSAIAMAIKYLDRWRGNCGRLTVRPNREQFQQLEDAFDQNHGHLTQEVIEDVKTQLDGAARNWL